MEYLKDTKMLTFTSSQDIENECERRGTKLENFPIPVIIQDLSGQKTFYSWLFTDEKKVYLSSLFRNERLEDEKWESYTPMHQGDVFLKDNKLYEVCFDKVEKYTIKNVVILYHEAYAYMEAQARNVECTKYEFCALYDVVAPQKTIGFCWLGYGDDGRRMLVKVFQDDCENLKINPTQLIFKPIAVGETFFAQNMRWCLLQDENGKLYIDEAVARSCKQKRQNKAEEQLAEDEKNVRLR